MALEADCEGKTLNWRALMSRVPQATKTADCSEALRRDLVRSHLLKLLELFEADESKVTTMFNHMDAKILDKPKKAAGSWCDQYKRLYRTPKTWQSLHLMRLSKGALTLELVKLIDQRDPEAIATIWFMALQVSPTDTWPPVLLSKATHDQFWDERAEQVATRWFAGWVKNYVNENGEINWREGGCYRVVFGSKAVTIRHIAGDEVEVSDTQAITQQFVLSDPADPFKAQLKCGLLKVDLHECFSSDKGPHLHKVNNTTKKCPFHRLLQEYEHAAKSKQGKKASVSAEAAALHKVMQEAASTRKSAMAAKASQAAAERRLKKRKVVKLSA